MKLPWPRNLTERMVKRDDGCIEFIGALTPEGLAAKRRAA